MNNISFTGVKNIGGYNRPLPIVPDPAIYSPRMGRKVAQEINDNICQQMFDYLM
ncbi:hypothetical protein IJO12_08735 [bacterium]|nr:hypothetical protein [bacterium]